MLAQYDFEAEHMDEAQRTVKDISGSGIDAEQKGQVKTAEGKDSGQAIAMDGEVGGYVKLSNALTKNTKEATISMDVKLNGVQIQAEPDCLSLGIWKKICFMWHLKGRMNFL